MSTPVFDRLFYTTSDKFLFWIAGFCSFQITDNVNMSAKFLSERASQLAALARVPSSVVRSRNFAKPHKYARMRCYFVKVDAPPKEAQVIGEVGGECWTMERWLEQ